MVNITLQQVIYSLMTLITGSGLISVVSNVPQFFVDLFNSHLGRIVILIMMLLQSGQPVYVSVVMSVLFYLFIVLLNKLEKGYKYQKLKEKISKKDDDDDQEEDD